MTKLYLTRLDYSQKKSGNIFALGLWCLSKNELHDFPDVNNNILSYIAGSNNNILISNQEVKVAYEKILPYLAEQLNTIHEQSLSKKFWSVLVGYWLMQYLGVLHNRYQILVNAHEKVPNAQVFLIPSNNEWIATDTDEYSTGLFSDRLNHQLFGQIIRVRKLFQIEDLNGLVNNNIERIGRKPGSENLKRTVFFLSCLFGKFNKVVFVRSYLPKKLVFKLSLKFFSIPILGTPKLKFVAEKIDIQKRNFLGSKLPIEATDFECLAMELLPKNIPTIFVEKLPNLLRIANYLRPKKAKVFITANAFSSQEIYKVWAGNALSDVGGAHVILQHGANYGQSKVYSDEDFETGSCSAFFTYGWRNKFKKNVFSLVASAKLGGIGAYQNNVPISNPEGDVLWVLASFPRFQYTQWTAPQGPEFLKYLNEQGLFLKSLSPIVKKKIICRPYMYDYGWGDLQFIKMLGGTFQCDLKRKPLQGLIKKANLTVFSYNSTSVMEAMALNAPTICFWDSKAWEWRSEAMSILKKLQEVGIYHDGAESAVAFINKRFLLNDLDKWWQSSSVQNAREVYCRNYANTGDNEYEQWSLKIKEWLG